MSLDFAQVGEASLLSFLIVFAGGVATSIGPCNIAMIPLVIAYVGGQRDVSRSRSFWLSLVFAIGLAITLSILGIAAALLGGLIGGGAHIWYYVVAAVCIIMGLQLLGVVHIPLPDIAARQRERVTQRGLLGALLLGLVSGLAASGCATPALAAILTLVMSRGALGYGALLLLTYGLGRGVPIVILGSFAGLLRVLPKMMVWSAAVEKVSGVIMIMIGLYFIWLA